MKSLAEALTDPAFDPAVKGAAQTYIGQVGFIQIVFIV